MLVILLAWIFATLLCWAWGLLALMQLKRILKDGVYVVPHFSIVCITGLMVVTVLSGILSLFMELGGWATHLLLVVPAFLVLFQKESPGFFSWLHGQFREFHPAVFFLLVASIAMILVMCTWQVNHPDTIGYHAQTIQWIEKFKVVPGLVHLHARYGYQGLWFVTEAFFDFQFMGADTLTCINSMVVVWYVIFVVQQINSFVKTGELVKYVLWLLLLAISFLSYTQLRLTVTSASPDFIATLVVWLVIYSIIDETNKGSTAHWLFIIVLSFFSLTLKLSAAPALLFAAYSVYQLLISKKTKALIISILFAIVILCPFLVRNTITSGYVIYPSVFPDVVNSDWKMDRHSTEFEKNYITAYARIPVDYDEKKVEDAMSMSMTDWMPVWWKNQGITDKVILIVLILSLITAILRVPHLLRSRPSTKAALVASFAGIIFWFVQAPDPRFGFGFIIGFIGLVASICFARSFKRNEFRTAMMVLVVLSACIISGYTVYRGIYFFSSSQLLKPMGITNHPSSTFNCNGVMFYRATDNGPCGNLPVPCISTDSCGNFKLRGIKISDGFRGK